MVSFEEFKKIEIKVAEIKNAEKIEGASKLLKLTIDLGSEERQLVAGIAENYSAEELVGKKILVVTNLDSRKIRGIGSQGMLLAAVEPTGNLSLVTTDRQVAAGTPIM